MSAPSGDEQRSEVGFNFGIHDNLVDGLEHGALCLLGDGAGLGPDDGDFSQFEEVGLGLCCEVGQDCHMLNKGCCSGDMDFDGVYVFNHVKAYDEPLSAPVV